MKLTKKDIKDLKLLYGTLSTKDLREIGFTEKQIQQLKRK
jgi:hypothetical protein